jgi:hypothetical protein
MTEKETGKRWYRRGGARGKDCRAGKIDILARKLYSKRLKERVGCIYFLKHEYLSALPDLMEIVIV